MTRSPLATAATTGVASYHSLAVEGRTLSAMAIAGRPDSGMSIVGTPRASWRPSGDFRRVLLGAPIASRGAARSGPQLLFCAACWHGRDRTSTRNNLRTSGYPKVNASPTFAGRTSPPISAFIRRCLDSTAELRHDRRLFRLSRAAESGPTPVERSESREAGTRRWISYGVRTTVVVLDGAI
jgi:hypothetical protein